MTGFDLKDIPVRKSPGDAELAKRSTQPLVRLADSIILLTLKGTHFGYTHRTEKRGDRALPDRPEELVDKLFPLPVEMALPLASRYKISSSMDITERRKPGMSS